MKMVAQRWGAIAFHEQQLQPVKVACRKESGQQPRENTAAESTAQWERMISTFSVLMMTA
jgi:hypothetical protein